MSLAAAIRRRVSPLNAYISAREYRRLVRTPTFIGGATQFLGKPLRYTDAPGLLHSIREIFVEEVYRFQAQSDAPHIIDAGANIGLSVLYFKRLYPNSTVIAYEPDPTIFSALEKNVGGLKGVELRQAAAWTEDTTLTFYMEGSLAGSTEIDFIGKQVPVAVKSERLKSELAKRPVDFLKIDIEGAETAVLFDIEEELERVHHLFFEYHSIPEKAQSLGDLLNLVSRQGYRYSINGTHGPKLPFIEKVPHGFDLQLNVFCFRD